MLKLPLHDYCDHSHWQSHPNLNTYGVAGGLGVVHVSDAVGRSAGGLGELHDRGWAGLQVHGAVVREQLGVAVQPEVARSFTVVRDVPLHYLR